MRTLYSIAALTLLALIAQGCGLKGPLRLPDKATPATTQPAQSSAPASSPESDRTKSQ